MLSNDDRAILEFEDRWNGNPARDAAIRETFGFAPIRYHQHLNRLLNDPAAEREYTLLVRRLRERRGLREGR